MINAKKRIFDGAFSLLRGAFRGRLRIYRVGRRDDTVISLFLDAEFQERESRAFPRQI